MKIDFVNTQKVKNGFNKTVNAGKAFYTNKVKPAVSDGIKYTKNLAHDTVDFVKKNPKTVVKYGALAMFAASVTALVVKGIKDLVNTKKQNTILKDTVLAQRDTINDLKAMNIINRDIMAAKDRVIEELRK